jgi:hypothetical protein
MSQSGYIYAIGAVGASYVKIGSMKTSVEPLQLTSRSRWSTASDLDRFTLRVV